MGCWGMGMAQSDEFCEIYDQFMECYDEGMAVEEITQKILAEYHEEFSDDDGVLHDVYFALAKAEWMCCRQSAPVLRQVSEIIESGANLDFYRELGASQKDLKTRKQNLDKFWAMLQEPRATPRRRKKKSRPAETEKGLVFWYKSKGTFYGAVVLETLSDGSTLVGLSNPLNAQPKSAEDVLNADVYTAAWFDTLLPANRMHGLGVCDVSGSYNGRAGMYHSTMVHFCENLGSDAHWNHEKRVITFESRKMRDLLVCENLPSEFRNQERLDTLLQHNRPVIWISL